MSRRTKKQKTTQPVQRAELTLDWTPNQLAARLGRSHGVSIRSVLVYCLIKTRNRALVIAEPGPEPNDACEHAIAGSWNDADASTSDMLDREAIASATAEPGLKTNSPDTATSSAARYRVPCVEVFTPCLTHNALSMGELAALHACYQIGVAELPPPTLVGCAHLLDGRDWIAVVGVRFDLGEEEFLRERCLESGVRLASKEVLMAMEEAVFRGPRLKRGLLALFD